MPERQTYLTNSPWEPIVGYARAVRSGSFIAVAGTTAWDPERGIVGPGDAEAQARHIYGIIRRALEALGSSLHDVVRTRTYLASIEDAGAVGRVHAECFQAIRPVATMIAGAVLVDPKLLVEIEVDAIVSDADAGIQPGANSAPALAGMPHCGPAPRCP